MPKINTVASKHVAPPATRRWSWLPFDETRHLDILTSAIRLIETTVKTTKPCNDAFKALPLHRSFTQVWADPNIWISYDPKNNARDFGVTNRLGGKEIAITEYALLQGERTVAATLIHELAHTNGATGTNHDAEGTLTPCLFSDIEDPTVIGMIPRLKLGRGLA